MIYKSNVIFMSEISISNPVWVELSAPVRSSSNLEFPFRFAPGPSFQIVHKESLYSWLDKKTYRMEMLVSKTWRKKSNGQKVRSAFAIKTLMWWLPVFPCDTWYQSTQNTIRLSGSAHIFQEYDKPSQILINLREYYKLPHLPKIW